MLKGFCRLTSDFYLGQITDNEKHMQKTSDRHGLACFFLPQIILSAAAQPFITLAFNFFLSFLSFSLSLLLLFAHNWTSLCLLLILAGEPKSRCCGLGVRVVKNDICFFCCCHINVRFQAKACNCIIMICSSMSEYSCFFMRTLAVSSVFLDEIFGYKVMQHQSSLVRRLLPLSQCSFM